MENTSNIFVLNCCYPAIVVTLNCCYPVTKINLLNSQIITVRFGLFFYSLGKIFCFVFRKQIRKGQIHSHSSPQLVQSAHYPSRLSPSALHLFLPPHVILN